MSKTPSTSGKRKGGGLKISLTKNTCGKKCATRKDFNKEHEIYKTKGDSKLRLTNVVQCLDSFQHGNLKYHEMKRLGEQIITQKLKDFHVYEIDPQSFDRRVTAMQFHPTNPHVIGLGSKSGLLAIRHLGTKTSARSVVKWEGIGPGGTITGISFDPFTPNSVFTSSIDGTVKVQNYGNMNSKVLLDTESYVSWYCSVNASHETGLIVTGDTSGILKVLNKDFKVVSQHRLHKKKINTVEFSKSQGWLLATASLDNTVKLWDIRKLVDKSPFCVLHHNHPVNSAYFSQTTGNRLLTTDQQDELRVYKAPLFKVETLIRHPHRQFQHLTPIKATWHPLCDLIIVGRYPDPNWPTYCEGELRTIDVISAETGEMKIQLHSLSCEGIISLNVFNCTGEILASGMGMFVPYWHAKTPYEWDRNANSDDFDQPLTFKRSKRTTQVNKRKKDVS